MGSGSGLLGAEEFCSCSVPTQVAKDSSGHEDVI